uniref:PNPLA domain-containing protein n=1 Tax=Octactis speculum TaxID=3111310 RepID=A0A7S2C3C3_9STRA
MVDKVDAMVDGVRRGGSTRATRKEWSRRFAKQRKPQPGEWLEKLHAWADQRKSWVRGFHHVREPGACETGTPEHRANVNAKDMARLARRITGRAVGLALGGGGARGLAEIGVLRALEEAGVDVDLVGGTSMGAFVGGCYAMGPEDHDALVQRARSFAEKMGSIWRKLFDLTLPITSFFSGRGFNAEVVSALGEHTRIEDLPLSYFCMTTDIVNSCEQVHDAGQLWKFVRASMTLAGYLPPFCVDDCLLLDGGYMNNLPADILKRRGANVVIVVDVGAEPPQHYFNFGDALSGWWLLWNKVNIFSGQVSVRVPSMGDISTSLAWVSSQKHYESVVGDLNSVKDLYLRPPVSKYGTLEFDKFDEIVEHGYKYAVVEIADWLQRNQLEDRGRCDTVG